MTSYGQMQEEKQEECIKFSLSVYESLSDDVSLIVNWSIFRQLWFLHLCGWRGNLRETRRMTCDQLEYRDSAELPGKQTTELLTPVATVYSTHSIHVCYIWRNAINASFFFWYCILISSNYCYNTSISQLFI